MEPQQLYADAALTMSSWRNVLIIIITGEVRPHHIAQLQRCYQQLAAEHPEGIGGLACVHDSVPLLDAATREASARMLKSLVGVLRRVVVVTQGSGVLFTMYRQLLRVLSTVSGNRGLMATQANVAAGAAELASSLPHGSLEPGELISAVHGVLRTHPQSPFPAPASGAAIV